MSITYTCPNCHQPITVSAPVQRCAICGAESSATRMVWSDGKEEVLCDDCLRRKLRSKAGPSEVK
jgi:hypothetical protein